MYKEYFTTREVYGYLTKYGSEELNNKVEHLIDDFIAYVGDVGKNNINEYKRIARGIESGVRSGDFEVRVFDPAEEESLKSNRGFKRIHLSRFNSSDSLVEEVALSVVTDLLDEFIPGTINATKVQLVKYSSAIERGEDSVFKYNLNTQILLCEKVNNATCKFIETKGTLFGGKTETIKETTVQRESADEK